MTKLSSVSESLEDYLEIVFHLIQEKRVARVRDIASRKGVQMASVTDALKRLARDNLVKYAAREYVELTEKGARLARKVVHRHEFLVRFLRDVLFLDPSLAERDACSIEHHITNETLTRLATFFQFVITYPQADKSFIESFKEFCAFEDGQAGRASCPTCVEEDVCPVHGPGPRRARRRHGAFDPSIVTLRQLKPGQAGRVVQLLAGRDIRHRLVEMGVLPNVRIEMEGTAPLGDPVRVRIKGYRLSMRGQEAASILVAKEEDERATR
jgi:DtxR family Mn-dependent transcriptional regulator